MASPPHVPQLNIPRKRGSVSSITSASKKRKPSQLRNSFAPDGSSDGGIAAASPLRFSRSPSVDSVATGSLANGALGRKRRRKDGGNDAASMTGSMRASKARSGVDGVEGREGEGEDEESEDDEDDDLDAIMESEETRESHAQAQEYERMLMEAMTPSQQDRYSLYRRIRLKREIVRKLVNQTLSQSVPQPVVIAVTSYSKAFIGDLIDRALTVRDEWQMARAKRPNPELPPSLIRLGLGKPTNHREGKRPAFRELDESGVLAGMGQGAGALGREKYLLDVEKAWMIEAREREERERLEKEEQKKANVNGDAANGTENGGQGTEDSTQDGQNSSMPSEQPAQPTQPNQPPTPAAPKTTEERLNEILREKMKDKAFANKLDLAEKGPLLPAHLREALRRYKRDREGGGAGFAGMSLEGVERTMARTGGRRLFR